MIRYFLRHHFWIYINLIFFRALASINLNSTVNVLFLWIYFRKAHQELLCLSHQGWCEVEKRLKVVMCALEWWCSCLLTQQWWSPGGSTLAACLLHLAHTIYCCFILIVKSFRKTFTITCSAQLDTDLWPDEKFWNLQSTRDTSAEGSAALTLTSGVSSGLISTISRKTIWLTDAWHLITQKACDGWK